jgi:hypothetical protein
MTPREHNRLVGIFLLAHGGLQALIMMIAGVIYGVLGAALTIGAPSEGKFVGVVFLAMIFFLFVFTILFAGPQILGGYKMLKDRPGARTWGIIGSVVSCLSFPLGTAAGVYGLWFLFGDEGKKHYLGAGNMNAFQPAEARTPQPGQWQ